MRRDDEDESLTYTIPHGTVLVGRDPQCEIRLADKSVSRDHARIEWRADRYIVFDNSSRNGTRVNGVAVVRHLLRDGDRIDFGSVEFTFHEVEKSSPAEAAGLDTLERVEAECTSPDVTSFLSFPDVSVRDVRAVNAWQIVRSFGACEPGNETELLRSVCENLAGIRGVHRVVLYTQPHILQGKACWVKGGAQRGQAGTQLPDQVIIDVSENGIPNPSTLGGPLPRGADRFESSVVCVPVFVAGRSRASLYVEGEEPLALEILESIFAAADAVGLGLQLKSLAAVAAIQPSLDATVGIVGGSAAIKKCVQLASRVARAGSTVLIRGESGTGKELFARLIYEESRRSANVFIPVHCCAIEETLLGSALFGHEKGAFTGAVGMKRGLFEEADGGTIFLDEIGELSLAMQVKLLRVLQEGEFMRLGGNQQVHVDVRMIAATNRNLEQAVRDGTFREDLYYRLKVIQLEIPPLRERREDIPDLVKHFVSTLSSSIQTRVVRVGDGAMRVLVMYDWPGNVRELRNIIERLLVLADGHELTEDDLPSEITAYCDALPAAASVGDGSEGMSLEAADKRHIIKVLRECSGNKKLAAKRLGISRSTLYEKLKERVGGEPWTSNGL